MTPTIRDHGRMRSVAKLLIDTSGNTLVILAMAMAPMTALAGSAVDMGRLYVAKVRLQQACDAGALAGRKAMTTLLLDATAKAQADQFFNFNYPAAWFGSTAITFTPAATVDGQVEATAKATVPMVIMQMFGKQPVELVVDCEARLEIPNTDVMFVLDTTGSMACAAADTSAACSTYVNSVFGSTTKTGSTWTVPEKTNARIKALRLAVTDFYATISAAIPATSRLRLGFVPYTSSVNVGYLLPSAYLVSTYTYQSRAPVYEENSSLGPETDTTNVKQTPCLQNPGTYVYPRTPASGYPAKSRSATWSKPNGSGDGRCRWRETTYTQVFDYWRYAPTSLDVSQFKTGVATQNPAMLTPALTTWSGCIEERRTVAQSTFTTVPANASDLDIDLIPTDDQTRWRPHWPEVIYHRNYAVAAVNDSTDRTAWKPGEQGGFAACPKRAQGLEIMTAAQVSAYVNGADFRAHGGTYHDIGMIWGARLISPTGIFAASNTAAPNGNPIGRHIIFMTDGDMKPSENIYGLYGVEEIERRVTGADPNAADLKNRHNARFLAMCNAARAKNITVWVVAFSEGLTAEETACADAGKAFEAKNDTELRDRFKAIASQIAELRLSR